MYVLYIFYCVYEDPLPKLPRGGCSTFTPMFMGGTQGGWRGFGKYVTGCGRIIGGGIFGLNGGPNTAFGGGAGAIMGGTKCCRGPGTKQKPLN